MKNYLPDAELSAIPDEAVSFYGFGRDLIQEQNQGDFKTHGNVSPYYARQMGKFKFLK